MPWIVLRTTTDWSVKDSAKKLQEFADVAGVCGSAYAGCKSQIAAACEEANKANSLQKLYMPLLRE